MSHLKHSWLFLVLTEVLSPGIVCGKKRSERCHGIRNDRNTSFHLHPKQDPDHIVLTIIQLVAAGSDDVGDDCKDAET